jgi:surface protein
MILREEYENDHIEILDWSTFDTWEQVIADNQITEQNQWKI